MEQKEQKKQEKISELNLKEEFKDLFFSLNETPKTMAECSAYLDMHYQTISQYLRVWVAKGWLRKYKTVDKRLLYMLNKEILIIG